MADVDPRTRRLENEWRLLLQLVDLNGGLLSVPERRRRALADCFTLQVTGWPAYFPPLGPNGPTVGHQFEVSLRYPRFFPSQSLEAEVTPPAFHPNVDPDSGLVCLWRSGSPLLTVADALEQLRRIVGWEVWNDIPEHTMQPDAAAWYQQASGVVTLPAGPQLALPAGLAAMRNPTPSERRRQRIFD